MKNNFQDPETGDEFFISSFRMIQKPLGGFTYKLKNGLPIKNPATGNDLEPIPKPEDENYELPFLIKSNNKAVRGEMLQKRSHEHFKKEISDIKYQKNKELIKNFKEQ